MKTVGEDQDPGAEDEKPSEPRRLFGRSAVALRQLAGALREDFAVSAAPARARLHEASRRGRAALGSASGIFPGRAWPRRAFDFVVAHDPLGPVRRRRPWLAHSIAAAAFVPLIAISLVLVWAMQGVPWAEIERGEQTPVMVLESADGEPLVQQGAYQAAYAPRAAFPDHLVDAVTSIEDHRFFEHGGLDLRGIARAMIRNLQAGGVVQGGSTITQQLIKVLYLERDRTFKRKVQEAVIASWLERRLGKDEILARYLNNVYLGAGATGMPAAARIYFNKEVGDLTLAESAMLAGLIKAPSQLNPINDPAAAERRASVVLDAMAAYGKIDAAERNAAAAQYADMRVSPPEARTGSWFSDWVLADAREIAGPYRGSMTIRTTLVPQLQRIAERVVRRGLQDGAADGASQAALVALRPDGSVVAMVGGLDYTASSFNRATNAKRQPGSTFKLFVYYAALKAGMSLNDQIEDAPIEIDSWRPENSDGRYYGAVTLAEAFARSLNAATAMLADVLGPEAVIAAARDLGLDAPLSPTPSLALGTSEVTLIDITGAYASVAAGRAPVEPWGIADFGAEDEDASFRVGPPKPAATELGALREPMTDLLQLAVERGTGREARLGSFAAGKTGTSQDYRDAWFIGFSEDLIVGVWVGNDDSSPMDKVSGGKLPATIWKSFMTAAMDADVAATAVKPGVDDGELACNVRACSRAYRSFRASDCTFQPYGGGRRLCEK